MKTIQRFLRLSLAASSIFLLTAPSQCLAMMDHAVVSPADAKKLGVEIKAQPAGPNAFWVSLELKTDQTWKEFVRVNLEIRDGEKLQLSAALKEKRTAPDRVVVEFATARADVDRMTLTIVSGKPMHMSAHDLLLKNFITQGAAPAENATEKPASIPAVKPAPNPARPAAPAKRAPAAGATPK